MSRTAGVECAQSTPTTPQTMSPLGTASSPPSPFGTPGQFPFTPPNGSPLTPPNSPWALINVSHVEHLLYLLKTAVDNKPSPTTSTAITVQHIQQFLGLMKEAVHSAPAPPSPECASSAAEVDVIPAKGRASVLEYKTLKEVYDPKTYQMKLLEGFEADPTSDSKWDQYVFNVRECFDRKKALEKTCVDINSEELRNALRDVFDAVKGVSLREDRPSVDPKLLYVFLPEIRNRISMASQNKATLTAHFGVLEQFLTRNFAAASNRLTPLLSHEEITFDLLWALFRPNTLLISTCPGTGDARCLKLEWAEKKQSLLKGTYFELDCQFLDYDGSTLGRVSTSVEIPEFRGAKKINSLSIFPFEFVVNRDEMKQYLVDRGTKFVSLMGRHHRAYEGYAFLKRKDQILKTYVDGRIMVDPESFQRVNPSYGQTPIERKDSSYFEMFGQAATEAQKPVQIKAIVSSSLNEQELMLCNTRVFGFGFANKTWAEFAVSRITKIQWDSVPFESLVLPHKEKRAIRALVESHTMEKSQYPFDDVVKGKGRGLIVTLHGGPGVGKTLTAEGIADYLQKPLYAACAGELGTDCISVEAKLSQLLDLAYRWDAILLIDEADVFLERRSTHEIHRNAIVSVFLRQLEYYRGIMFLTTNRVETFDEAFQSRIHVGLRYGNLTAKARLAIWKTFTRSGTDSDDLVNSIANEELEYLARSDLNGRQIRNTIRTAHALAISEKEAISYKHIIAALDVTVAFDKDLNGMGQTENMMSYA